jgi:hypothetical protein
LFAFFCFVILQLPLVNKFVLFDNGFGFFYLGFLLFLPIGLNPFLRIFLGFVIGMFIDVFSNTPGLHAMAATFVMFSRDWWYLSTMGEPDDNKGLSLYSLRGKGIVLYLFPLILIYMFIVFFVEHGSFQQFFMILSRVLNSAAFTLVVILVISYTISSRPKRI